METIRVTPQQMEQRVARCAGRRGSDPAFLDQRMPGYRRELINLLGMNVTENVSDPRLARKIGNAHGFSVAMARADPGNGAGLHWHSSVIEAARAIGLSVDESGNLVVAG
jgi:hypothetical protein